MKKNKLQGVVLPLVISVVFSFIILAFATQSSFLYNFNARNDINCFMTTIRCMMRGDVLYRDVYEHKGPILYFIYAIGYKLIPDSFVGFYVIEAVFYAVFGFFTFKTAELFTESRPVQYIFTLASMIMPAFSFDFNGGGQCEELALPFIAMTMFFMLRHYKIRPSERIRFWEIFLIGAGFAVTFWMKYTVTGFYAGLVLGIVIIQLKDKKFADIFRYAGAFLAGTIFASLPVIIYFGVNRAFDSMWEVYFYNLIFRYKPEDSMPLTKSFVEVILHYTGLKFALIYLWFADKRTISANGKIAAASIILGGGLGMATTRPFNYIHIPFSAFNILALCGLYVILCRDIPELLGKSDTAHRAKRFHKQTIVTILDRLCALFANGYFRIFMVFAVFAAMRMFRELTVSFITAAVIILLISGANTLLSRKFTKQPQLTRLLIAEYAVIAAVCVICFLKLNVNKQSLCFNCVLIFGSTVITDLYRKRLILDPNSKLLTGIMRSSKKLGTAFVMLAVCVCCFMPIRQFVRVYVTNGELMRDLNEYPVYQFSRYIKESGIDDPKILTYKCLDHGIYYLTGTYPPERYFCSYNIELEDIDEINSRYIDGKEADFIFTIESVDSDNYRIAASDKLYDAANHRYNYYYLYERND